MGTVLGDETHVEMGWAHCQNVFFLIMEEDVGGTILTFYFLFFKTYFYMYVCVYVCVVPMESREGHQIPIKTVLT